MDRQEFDQLELSPVLESSADPSRLSFKLQQILGTREAFSHHGMIPEGASSTRIFYANPREGELACKPGEGSAEYIGRTLMEAITVYDEIRHPPRPAEPMTKGWEIRSVEVDGRAAAIAIAAWV